MTSAVVLHGLVKDFGRTRALDGVDLEVAQGRVFGFLGPNGAGKTTTLRILTGLSRPTSGRATVMGMDVVREAEGVRAVTGHLPDVPGFYDWMTASEFLSLVGRVFGLDRSSLARRVDALLELSGLSGVDARIGEFSRGMRQRLGIAQALVNAPEVLLLDEPTSALDPVGRREVLEMIGALRGKATVFFSTHILSDVERVCEEVAVLDRGRVLRQSEVAALKREVGSGGVRVSVVGDPRAFADVFSGASWLASVEMEEDGFVLKVRDESAARRAVVAAACERQVELLRLETVEHTLEDVFVQLVGDQGAEVG